MELLTYDPATGDFRWCVNRGNNGGGYVSAGYLAGSIYSNGYRNIAVDGRRYGAHRLAWFYMTGEWPADEIDHINGDRADNRFTNLREASRSQNEANKATRNRLGFKGVRERSGRFQASIKLNGKRVHLGTYGTPEEAHAAFLEAANDTYGQFVRVS